MSQYADPRRKAEFSEDLVENTGQFNTAWCHKSLPFYFLAVLKTCVCLVITVYHNSVGRGVKTTREEKNASLLLNYSLRGFIIKFKLNKEYNILNVLKIS